jgi:hypothetical protein
MIGWLDDKYLNAGIRDNAGMILFTKMGSFRRDDWMD